ncbi:DUF4235 domain-containing protein [Bifidobacterium sp. MA2]|uniref:DUF4235 domain-containing protein n=1 Tax=Bifidobacterium santillanense TaxID=2809028 RepID=A0ABS5UQG1_9BIFI|nr:DUF4235 domain-containing protein [Bifidobacterium santillanense]MBT1173080.1 DUF4235 domain-containing protein [Bifidobacterium santillanense]
MSDETTRRRHAANDSGFSSTADEAVEALHRVDEKVDELRNRRLSDPDSLGDKLFKWAFPSIIGLVAGKAFQMMWDRGASSRNLARGRAADAPQGFVASMLFAAASAAFGAVVSQLSDRGSKAFVARRHRRHAARRGRR